MKTGVTHAQYIRNMTIDDLAEMLATMCSACRDCDSCYFNDDCANSERESAWEEWLESDEYP